MNLIGIIREYAVKTRGTQREASEFSCTVYAPVERSDGHDPNRTKTTAIGTLIQNPVLQRCHQA